MRRRLRAILPVVVPVGIVVAALTCLVFNTMGDGYISVTGTVHEWKDPPEGQTSRLCWDGEIPAGVNLVPLADAEVTLFHARDHAKKPIEEDSPWREDAVTDPEGHFLVEGTTNPRPFHAVLRVEKKGYEKLEEMFLHNAQDRKVYATEAHRVTVLLVRQR